jgi:hypothetical protein
MQPVRVAFFAVYLFLIVLVCLRDTFFVLAESTTFFPRSIDRYWRAGQTIASIPLGETLSLANPIRQGIAAFLQSGGIQAGYGYFAPNVPNNYKIVFEVHYADGRIEYELPRVGTAATGLRLTSLLDRIVEESYEPLRAMFVKMLAYSIWQDHQDARSIRAVVGYVELPTPDEFERGQKESYHGLFAYDFDFSKAKSRRR